MSNLFHKAKNVFANLIKLNVSGNVIGDGAAAALRDALSYNNQLEELNLSDNNLYSEVLSIIVNELNIPTLLKFSISHNNITSEAAGDITNFLSKCTKLEHLDLSHNNLQDAGAVTVYQANVSSLTSFNITIYAADYIAHFLSHNMNMQISDLRYNGLLEFGVRNIFKGMQIVQSIFGLSVLNISNCNAINEIVDELTEILLINTELRELDLSHNDLLKPNAVKIFEGKYFQFDNS